MISPVFAGGDLCYFVASRAHHADVGGMTPGSAPLSTELYQEGLIIPPVKLRLSGWMNEGAMDLLVANSRNPAERLGDLEAQMAANRIGEQRLLDMMVEHGVEETAQHASALLAYSRRMTQAVIAGIPDGVYHYRDAMEGDGQAEFEIPIQVGIEVRGETMTVDFSGSAPQAPGNVNAVPAIVRSATWYCVRLMAGEDIPVNHGCFQPVEVITPEGSFLNPRFPAAVVVGNTETSQRIVDTVLGALAQAMPEIVPAASLGTMNNFALGGVDGDAQFVYYETLGGGHGASSRGDGLSGRHCHMTNTLNTPVEALEYSLPMRVLRYHLREGSGGSGRHRGGDGIVREYENAGAGDDHDQFGAAAAGALWRKRRRARQMWRQYRCTWRAGSCRRRQALDAAGRGRSRHHRDARRRWLGGCSHPHPKPLPHQEGGALDS